MFSNIKVGIVALAGVYVVALGSLVAFERQSNSSIQLPSLALPSITFPKVSFSQFSPFNSQKSDTAQTEEQLGDTLGSAFGVSLLDIPGVDALIKRIDEIDAALKSIKTPSQTIYRTVSQTIDNTITKYETIDKTITNTTSTTVNTKASDFLPDAVAGNPLFYQNDDWDVADDLFLSTTSIGIGRTPTKNLDVAGDARVSGTLTLDKNGEGNSLSITPTGDSGFLSSVGGAVYIDNTNNIGSALGIFSDAGAEAQGNMMNIKINNPEFAQAAFYMDYFGTSNAVEIRNNTNDTSSNALSVTNFNQLDSAVGIIGYENDRGTVKISHNKAGNDANASGLSIDLKGTNTAAQGIYVDSTATTGTTGKLLRLRNQTIDRFIVDAAGSVSIGSAGTNSSLTKIGNTTGDEFFVGTSGAFRVQRSAASSEAFRVQVYGDTFGRWLGTSDGKLRWSSGSETYDITLERSAAKTLRLTNAIFEARSPEANSDIMRWQGSGGARVGRFIETSGGHGWFEVSNSAAAALVRFRADGGDNFVNTGNLGVGNAAPGAKLDVTGDIRASSDVEVTDATKGIILKSPNGTRWRVTVGNDGVLTTNSL